MNEKKPPQLVDRNEEADVPPGNIFRQGISDADWYDWRWQLAHSLSKPSDFKGAIEFLPEELQALQTPGMFKIGVTPYFASLIDPHDPHCPIRRQVIPTIAEKQVSLDEMADSLGEESHSPVPG